jgi:hypothetical protein
MSVALEITDSIPPNIQPVETPAKRFERWEKGQIGSDDLLPEDVYRFRQFQQQKIGRASLSLVELYV